MYYKNVNRTLPTNFAEHIIFLSPTVLEIYWPNHYNTNEKRETSVPPPQMAPVRKLAERRYTCNFFLATLS